MAAAIHTASVLAGEADVRRLAGAIEADDDLAALAVDALEEKPGLWRLTTYLPPPLDKAVVARLQEIAKAALGATTPGFVVEALPETDWVRKSLEGLKPVRAGRFLVHGAHDRDKARANDIAIEIEAGEAFGTGHHGTTAGCLLAIERAIRTGPVRNALDIGTGTGVLAIAIARLAHCPVLASDIDPVAARVAMENVRLNGAAPEVRVVAAAGIAGRLFRANAPYDLIVANILAGPLVALAPSVVRVLAPGGTLILSGLTTSQRTRVANAYRGLGLRLVRTNIRDDWATLTLTRPLRR
ncbi:MAG: 50S ribosomal protein L11 methyltransferase [Bauldia sp.]|nr:50S ribosomal protein L11 methyltransferase [Bauldia sp.]